MILTSGGRFAGYGFYLLKGKPVFLWNLLDLKQVRWAGPTALSPGRHKLEFDFKYDGFGIGTLAYNSMSGLGRSGTGTLKDADYLPPFPLTAQLNKLTIEINRPQLTEEDIEKLENTRATAVDGSPIQHLQSGPR